MQNGVTNGQPISFNRRAIHHSTKVYPSPFPANLLPASEWSRNANREIEVTTHLTYEHRAAAKLKGSELYGMQINKVTKWGDVSPD